jgi:DNA-binding NtrC family response regulator
MSGRVLVVDDVQSMCELLQKGLSKRGFEVAWCTRAEDAQPRLEAGDFDVVLADLQLGSSTGLDLCHELTEIHPDLPVVVITAFGTMETAIAAIRVGAYDFITKPVDMDALAITLGRAVQHRTLRAEVRRLRSEARQTTDMPDIVGDSRAMRRVYDLIARLDGSGASVLITGESGTGKELVARALHRRSPRAEGSFVAVNCASLPPTLLESELFGHVRGAFTDAKSARKGLLLEADRGTLFLDEIGDMPLAMQAKLLRALQEQSVRPVGGSADAEFDARVLAATNRDLDSDVEAGRFREDLFYRIDVVRIHVPPLRSRDNDVLLLAQHFLTRVAGRTQKKVGGIAPAAAAKLLEYSWPGNVRELENCIERAVTLTSYDQVTVQDLPERIRRFRATDLVISGEDPEQLLRLDELEQRYVERVLQLVGGNKTQAAKILGFDRRTLYRKIARLGRPPDEE